MSGFENFKLSDQWITNNADKVYDFRNFVKNFDSIEELDEDEWEEVAEIFRKITGNKRKIIGIIRKEIKRFFTPGKLEEIKKPVWDLSLRMCLVVFIGKFDRQNLLEKSKFTENQVNVVLDLIFGKGASKDLTAERDILVKNLRDSLFARYKHFVLNKLKDSVSGEQIRASVQKQLYKELTSTGAIPSSKWYREVPEEKDNVRAASVVIAKASEGLKKLLVEAQKTDQLLSSSTAAQASKTLDNLDELQTGAEEAVEELQAQLGHADEVLDELDDAQVGAEQRVEELQKR